MSFGERKVCDLTEKYDSINGLIKMKETILRSLKVFKNIK